MSYRPHLLSAFGFHSAISEYLRAVLQRISARANAVTTIVAGSAKRSIFWISAASGTLKVMLTLLAQVERQLAMERQVRSVSSAFGQDQLARVIKVYACLQSFVCLSSETREIVLCFYCLRITWTNDLKCANLNYAFSSLRNSSSWSESGSWLKQHKNMLELNLLIPVE